MKTTLELPDRLLREAKKFAADRGMSLKAVIEMALRNVLDNKNRPHSFKLRKASFKGEGVQEGIQEGDWTAIRKKIYEGRGE